ncbi:MAG: KpsF/GutQ family sugar-phosphate isomerase [candidate division KSB1 bacterium]|nr:KpsF/GutQ family sugar-phosphate isomerase [candidate division KSB1 bacterium]
MVEARAVERLCDRLGGPFLKALDLLYHCKGRVIVTGIGKSGIVARKIASTLASTGTAAYYLHPSEGMHGDIGVVMKDDVVVCVSKSGNTDELTRLIPILKKIGVPIITLTGNLRSALALKSDVVLDVSVEEEACPFNLAPTASSTAALAMGDALAVALLQRRGVRPEDFALLHPGGSLGRQLNLRVEDVMFTNDAVPRVGLEASLEEAIFEIARKRFGATCVVDGDGRLAGIITDGDLRRLLQRRKDIWDLRAKDVMTTRPKVVEVGSMAVEALRLMEEFNILQVIVIDGDRRPVGMIHLHDLLEAGLS